MLCPFSYWKSNYCDNCKDVHKPIKRIEISYAEIKLQESEWCNEVSKAKMGTKPGHYIIENLKPGRRCEVMAKIPSNLLASSNHDASRTKSEEIARVESMPYG